MATTIRLNRVTSKHYLIFKTADKDASYYVSVSGIVQPKLRSIKANWDGKKWTYGDLTFEVPLPTQNIPRPKASSILRAKRHTIYASLNNIFDDGTNYKGLVKNSGHALDSFGLTNAGNLSGNMARIQCALAVKAEGTYSGQPLYRYLASGVELRTISFKINLLLNFR